MRLMVYEGKSKGCTHTLLSLSLSVSHSLCLSLSLSLPLSLHHDSRTFRPNLEGPSPYEHEGEGTCDKLLRPSPNPTSTKRGDIRQTSEGYASTSTRTNQLHLENDTPQRTNRRLIASLKCKSLLALLHMCPAFTCFGGCTLHGARWLDSAGGGHLNPIQHQRQRTRC